MSSHVPYSFTSVCTSQYSGFKTDSRVGPLITAEIKKLIGQEDVLPGGTAALPIHLSDEGGGDLGHGRPTEFAADLFQAMGEVFSIGWRTAPLSEIFIAEGPE